MPKPRLLTTREIADKMSISSAAVNKWTEQGLEFDFKPCALQGRPYKVIKLSDLKRFINKHKPKYKIFLKLF